MPALEELDNLTEQALTGRDYQKAQQYAWQQLDIDPLHEPAVRQLMTALAHSGQRSAAMAQYEIYRKRLQEASGDEPSAELTKLYQRIQNDELQQTMLRHPAAVSPDGVINPIFCYTDIESSTRLWDEHREAMLWALRQHNDLCETEIERFDGRILHPTGDGFLIVFEQNDPIQFAIALQQQFAQADWGEIGELRIRIGFHGATADQEGHEFFHDDGGWYRGPVLNHAARIADTGQGTVVRPDNLGPLVITQPLYRSAVYVPDDYLEPPFDVGPYPKGEPLGFTMGDWIAASGKGTYTQQGSRAEVNLQFDDLVPNAVYTVWCVTLVWPTFELIAEAPCGAPDGADNLFTTDNNGHGELLLAMEAFPPSTNEIIYELGVAYHSDGQTHGEIVGERGKNAHVHLVYDFLPPEE